MVLKRQIKGSAVCRQVQEHLAFSEHGPVFHSVSREIFLFIVYLWTRALFRNRFIQSLLFWGRIDWRLAPGGSDSKESACNAGDLGIFGSGRSPGGGHGNPVQYSCLENPMDRGAWRATVHGVARAGHDSATKPPHGGGWRHLHVHVLRGL